MRDRSLIMRAAASCTQSSSSLQVRKLLRGRPARYTFSSNSLCALQFVTEAVIVHNSLLPQTRNLRSDGKFDKTTAVNQRSLHRGETSDKLLVCTVKIRILQVVQVFDMQCLFSLVNRFASKKSEVPVAVDTSSETRAQRSTNSQLFMYECLYLITLIILIVLVVTNVTSFLVWLIKLAFRPCEDSHLPLDGYFLLQMAKENDGLDFVTVLSSGEMLQDGTGRDDIELKLWDTTCLCNRILSTQGIKHVNI